MQSSWVCMWVCVWVFGLWLFIAMLPLCCLRFPLAPNTPSARLSQPPFVPHRFVLHKLQPPRADGNATQATQATSNKPLTHAPNGQFEQRFGRLAAQTVRADYRHYLWNSVYQKIKWENQSLSLILKRFSPRAYYQVLNGAENRRGKKKEVFNSKERNGI